MTETGSPPFVVYKRLWTYTRRYKWMFALGIVGVSVDAAMQASFIKFMEPLIDRVFVGKDSDFGLWLAGVIFLVAITRMVGNFVGVYGMEWVGRRSWLTCARNCSTSTFICRRPITTGSAPAS